MTQIIFNLQTSDGTESHILTEDGWLRSEFSGLSTRRWIPELPDFLRTRGFLEPAFTLRIHPHPLSATQAALLGVPSLRVLGNATDTQAIAVISRQLDPGQCAAVFQFIPHLFAVAHGPTVTLAPPPTSRSAAQGPQCKSLPEFTTLRPWKPLLQVVGNLDDNGWP